MRGREAARQAVGEPLLYLRSSRGGLEVVPGGYRADRGGFRLVDHNPQETVAAFAPVRAGLVPSVQLLRAAVVLLLEAITDGVPGNPDAAALTAEGDLGPAEPDRVLLPALIRVALELPERRAGHGAAETARVSELAGLFGDVKSPAPRSAEPAWPGEPLTESETRVLRYLPTHMRVQEIAAELYLSPNTVKTHLRHLYRKLGAHNRHEAVQRARTIGLLAGSARRP